MNIRKSADIKKLEELCQSFTFGQNLGYALTEVVEGRHYIGEIRNTPAGAIICGGDIERRINHRDIRSFGDIRIIDVGARAVVLIDDEMARAINKARGEL